MAHAAEAEDLKIAHAGHETGEVNICKIIFVKSNSKVSRRRDDNKSEGFFASEMSPGLTT